MKLDEVTNKQLMMGLGTAVIILSVVCIVESYALNNLIDTSDKLLGVFEPMFIQYTHTMNCNDAEMLKDYTQQSMLKHGVSAQIYDKDVINAIKERCG